MLLRQLFNKETHTYIIANKRGGEATIIDPVDKHIDLYSKLLNELDIKLLFAINTHAHADHVTGIGKLQQQNNCKSVMGEQSKAASEYADIMNNLNLPNPKYVDIAVLANLKCGLQ